MAKYNVIVTRSSTHEARIVVDAESRAEATRIAQASIFAHGTEIWETIETVFDYETHLAPAYPGGEE